MNALCERQLSFFAKPATFNNYNIILNYKSELSEGGSKIIDDDTISCTKTMSFGRSSSTLVSFTFAACDSRVGLYLNYEVTFINSFPSPMLGACEEFSICWFTINIRI